MSRSCNHDVNIRKALESLNEAQMALEQALVDGENCLCQEIEETEHHQPISVLTTHGLTSFESLQVAEVRIPYPQSVSEVQLPDGDTIRLAAQDLYERGRTTYPRSVAEVQRVAALDAVDADRMVQDFYERGQVTYPRSASDLHFMIPENKNPDMADVDESAEK